MAIICPNCQQELDEEVKFCAQCGYQLKKDQPAKEEVIQEKKSRTSESILELTRVNRPQSHQKRRFSWQEFLGVFLVFLAFFLLGLNYQLNYSAARVEDHFRKGLRFDNYERVARVTTSPVTYQAWGPEDIGRLVDNYNEAGIDVKQLVMDIPRGEAIYSEDLLIAELERVGSYLLLFPRYKMMVHALPVDLSVPNHYRDIALKVAGQKEQPLSATEALVIEPRASEIEIDYSVDGQEETVRLNLAYSDLRQGRHRINLIPVTNRLEIEPASLGIRPRLKFELLGLEIDGQLYEEDIINLSGFVGQVFSVKLFADYNGVPLESSLQEVTLVASSEVLLDFREDEAFQRQIRQAEQNSPNQ